MDEFDEFEDIHTPEGRAALIERLQREVEASEADIARRRYERETAEILARRAEPSPPPPPPPPPQPKPGAQFVTKAMLDKSTEITCESIGRFISQKGHELEARMEQRLAAERAEFAKSATSNAVQQVARLTELKEVRETAMIRVLEQINSLRAEALASRGEVLALRAELLDMRSGSPPPRRFGGKALAVRPNGYDHDG